MVRRLALLLVAILGFVSPAEALTVRDILELSRAGLGEEVLLALIDVDRGIYAIDTKTLKALKEAGVPDSVIVAMVRSGRERPADPLPPPVVEETRPPDPQVVVIDHREAAPVREVFVPVPVYVPVATTHFRRSRISGAPASVESTFVPFQSGPPLSRPQVQQHEPEPVYWGFGGKLRPDAWKPEGHKPEAERAPDKKK